MTAPTNKISKPILRVTLEDPTADGQLVEYTVQTDNRDAVRFDIMRARQNWPGGDVAPMLWMTVQAWSAMRRSKVEPFASMKAEAFFDVCVDLVPVDEDGNPITDPDAVGGMIAHPTNEAVASDS